MTKLSIKTTTRLLLAATLLADASVAGADPDDTAAGALEHGQIALRAGRVHEACQAFEASEKLDAKIATELDLADCYEQDGKLMAAARLYRAAAEKDSNAGRAKTSSEKAARLETLAPKLRFAINPRPEGLVIKVDGVEVASTGDIRVDVGPHEVTATAPGYEGHASAPVDRPHGTVDVIIRMQPRAEPAPAPTPAPAPPPAPPDTTEPAATPAPAPRLTDTEPTDHRKRYGVIAGGVGVAALIGTAVVYELSAGKFDDEHTLCPDSKCATAADLTKARSQLSDGHTLRGVAIGMGIGSGVLIVAGAYLLLAPHHKESSHVTLHVGHDDTGLAYTGSF